eukprot:CAMPEP_0179214256 /NCGR_PEP_ID=MMETSP0797-20121207/2215_1 /TAXON_ID=47934 /ORGANISM="Dinophysis acuminata, Strain DAEP01" /LENGTH=543 /DNA_ID=CAMNT_0020920269 /DNA_START=83 /DNA_END=1714 /DNA_ORIENTATION=+
MPKKNKCGCCAAGAPHKKAPEESSEDEAKPLAPIDAETGDTSTVGSPPKRGLSSMLGGMMGDAIVPNGFQDPKDWRVGGRYTVCRKTVPVFGTPELIETDQVGELRYKDEALILKLGHHEATQERIACVTGASMQQPGWVSLEEKQYNTFGCAFIGKPLPNSWQMKARYMVNYTATIRDGPMLSSDKIDELAPGVEVLVLDLALCDDAHNGKARLRAMVNTDSGIIGWLSPETQAGHRLLDPVNLLGPDVVKVHRKSLKEKDSSLHQVRASIRSISQEGSELSGEQLPWVVGGKYRTLEPLQLKETRELAGRTLAKVPAGCIVLVEETHCCAATTNKSTGWAPSISVRIEEGSLEGKCGWLRCASPRDGHDLVDTRNQLEFEQVHEKLKQLKSQAKGTLATDGDEGRDEQDYGSKDPSRQPSEDGSRGGGDARNEEKLSDKAYSPKAYSPKAYSPVPCSPPPEEDQQGSKDAPGEERQCPTGEEAAGWALARIPDASAPKQPSLFRTVLAMLAWCGCNRDRVDCSQLRSLAKQKAVPIQSDLV